MGVEVEEKTGARRAIENVVVGSLSATKVAQAAPAQALAPLPRVPPPPGGKVRDKGTAFLAAPLTLQFTVTTSLWEGEAGREMDSADVKRGQDTTPLVVFLVAGAGNTSLPPPLILSGHWYIREGAWQPAGFLSQLQGAPLCVAEGVAGAEGEAEKE